MALNDKGRFLNKYGKNCRFTGSKPTVLCKVTNETLAETFKVTVQTIIRWKNNNLLDPKSLSSICELYLKRNSPEENYHR